MASWRKPLLNKTVRRPRLNEKALRNLVARRYGSLDDFSQVVARWCDIGRATGVHPQTCRRAVALFHRRGNRFTRDSANSCPLGPPRRIPPELEARLVSRETLYEMRFLSMPRRAELIRRDHGISIGRCALAKLYKRNGVKYLQATKVKRLSHAREERLELERVAFARKLAAL